MKKGHLSRCFETKSSVHLPSRALPTSGVEKSETATLRSSSNDTSRLHEETVMVGKTLCRLGATVHRKLISSERERRIRYDALTTVLEWGVQEIVSHRIHGINSLSVLFVTFRLGPREVFATDICRHIVPYSRFVKTWGSRERYVEKHTRRRQTQARVFGRQKDVVFICLRIVSGLIGINHNLDKPYQYQRPSA